MTCTSRRRKGNISVRKGGTKNENAKQKDTRKTYSSRFKSFFNWPRTQKGPRYFTRIKDYFSRKTHKVPGYVRFNDFFRSKTPKTPSAPTSNSFPRHSFQAINEPNQYDGVNYDGVNIVRDYPTDAERNKAACKEKWDWQTNTCISNEEYHCKQNYQSKWLPDTKKCLTFDEQIAEEKKQCLADYNEWDDLNGECVSYEDAVDDEEDEYFR